MLKVLKKKGEEAQPAVVAKPSPLPVAAATSKGEKLRLHLRCGKYFPYFPVFSSHRKMSKWKIFS